MDATITEAELRSLGNHLETLLQERNIPVGIRCGFQDGRLIIVGFHPPEVILEPVQVLQSLQNLVASFRLAFTRRVRLYLRVLGRPLPYARCHFLVDDQREFVVPEELTEPVQITAWLEDIAADKATPFSEDLQPRGALLAPEIHVVDWEVVHNRGNWAWVNGIENSLAVTAVMGMALSGYLVSQPCVGGACPQLQTAQTLGQEFQQRLAVAQNYDDLKEAQDYLTGAVSLLETIPPWSGRSPEARTLSANYREQTKQLEQAMAAARLAITAWDKSENFINQLESWATIQLLWQDTIDKLEAIPPDSPLYAFAERKLELYRPKLALAKEQRALEAVGQEELFIARQEIQQAQNKHAKAVTATDWEKVWTIWDTAINRLHQISPETQAGLEARRLLAAYGGIPRELGDRLQIGIPDNPEPPPERSYQTPVNWANLNMDVNIPPPPLILR
ncbi:MULTISPECIES: hypothetical protein [unclassified Leptolyngbya]|uniref:hypothetical protein n=1 Tax=unclassified Leptolyngbya TaxID=2650499 RepID=UPI001688F273|nr:MULTISPECIES: hypothetical protein [unclassified Leptolyngbya]MBD1913601.1 hypothetical protein [Leptolyngbya sp. FACHB-8]MBD2154068.1 hypothetical protein [Leptolyngbya sp. FACHB-16]